jgi:hypothetical protein
LGYCPQHPPGDSVRKVSLRAYKVGILFSEFSLYFLAVNLMSSNFLSSADLSWEFPMFNYIFHVFGYGPDSLLTVGAAHSVVYTVYVVLCFSGTMQLLIFPQPHDGLSQRN